MFKIFIVGLILIISGCTPHNENYYRMHLKALQEALSLCPEKSPADISCAKLNALGKEINGLVYELQRSPQQFGSTIITLQNKLAEQKINAVDLESVAITEEQLKQRLAIIRWLESPES